MLFKWAALGGLLAIALMLAGTAFLSLKHTEYHWQPEPTLEHRHMCAPAGNTGDCFRTLGYKWEAVRE